LSYEARDDEFSNSIIEYKEKLQSWVESQLYTRAYNGAKFNLSNNYKRRTEKQALTNKDGEELPQQSVVFYLPDNKRNNDTNT
jgi:hypothetical protein